MTEPSLSSDTRSMLHDEHSKRLDKLEKALFVTCRMCAEMEMDYLQLKVRLEALEHLFKGLPCDNHDERVLEIEECGIGYAERLAVSEEHVQTLEQCFRQLTTALDYEQLIELDPLPWGDQD